MKKLLPFSGVIGSAALAVPMVAAAQETLGSILNTFDNLIGGAVGVVLSLAILIFIFGLIKYLTKTGDSDAQAEARNVMIWGIIIFFVAVSVWGLVAVLQDTFGIGQGTFQEPPLD